jgi:hypothetical protein
MEGCAKQEGTTGKRAAGNKNYVDTAYQQKREKPRKEINDMTVKELIDLLKVQVPTATISIEIDDRIGTKKEASCIDVINKTTILEDGTVNNEQNEVVIA